MDSANPKDRRLILFGGAALALVAGLAIALGLSSRHGPTPKMDPIQSKGLQVQMGTTGQTGAAGDKGLRCFVGGAFVAVTSLSDCARRNGVATDALDVGLDASGQVAATGSSGVALQPLPQPVTTVPPVAQAAPAPAVAATSGSQCMRYNGSEWRSVGDGMSLNDCMQALFSGRCETPGSASYGRWGQQTIRLVPGKVERAYDNRTFSTLAAQSSDCRLARIAE